MVVVGLRAEPGKPLSIEIDPQWIAACQQHVQSKIKLKATNQEGVGNVYLNDALLCDFLWLQRYLNTSALA